MDIGILGTGYVGLVTGACFAKKGHRVVCMDVDHSKVQRLNQCEIPIYEPGLREIVEESVKCGTLCFTENQAQAIENMDICMIAVGTPIDPVTNGADMRYVLSAAEMIGKHWQKNTHIVIKSTIPVGSHERIRSFIIKELQAREIEDSVSLTFNPEFLREGSAVRDCLYPDRVILGIESAESEQLLRELYASFAQDEFIISMDIASAEMTKYASNGMLATKISFINEIANICERVGGDIRKVCKGMGMDPRIGVHFLNPGCGYGGSCFPKDVAALIKMSDEKGYRSVLLKAVETVNNTQKRLVLEKVKTHFNGDISKCVIAVWGLAFKPNTDDMRCAPAIELITGLVEAGARIHAYDPQAVHNAQEIYLKDCSNVEYYSDPYDALTQCDALVVMTEWDIFVNADYKKIRERLRQLVVFDGRNIFDAEQMKQNDFCYYPIGFNEGQEVVRS